MPRDQNNAAPRASDAPREAGCDAKRIIPDPAAAVGFLEVLRGKGPRTLTAIGGPQQIDDLRILNRAVAATAERLASVLGRGQQPRGQS